MKLAEIKGGLITNVIEVNPDQIPDWARAWPEVTGRAGIGWRLDGQVFVEPEVAPPAPDPIPALTFAQMLIGLVAEGWITRAEGEAWLDGMLPTPVALLIAKLPVAAQFPAIARAKRPSVVNRDDGLVVALAATQGRTAAQMDAFFTTYAAI